MAATIFQKIIDREIPANIVYEDDRCLAFHDVAPQAPVHVLLIPKKHIESIDDLADDDSDLLGHMWITLRNLARELKLDDGYRVVVNCGKEGGQAVDHLHFHLLGGAQAELASRLTSPLLQFAGLAAGLLHRVLRRIHGKRTVLNSQFLREMV